MTPPSEAPSTHRAPARLTLFGFGPTRATVRLKARSRAWRLSRTVRVLAATALAAPLLGLVPPHAPWALGALATGIVLARRRWIHRFSVVELRGRCPRCAVELSLAGGVRLRDPHPVPCEGCHHQPSLELSEPPTGHTRKNGGRNPALAGGDSPPAPASGNGVGHDPPAAGGSTDV